MHHHHAIHTTKNQRSDHETLPCGGRNDRTTKPCRVAPHGLHDHIRDHRQQDRRVRDKNHHSQQSQHNNHRLHHIHDNRNHQPGKHTSANSGKHYILV
jgi:hypothetical protein